MEIDKLQNKKNHKSKNMFVISFLVTQSLKVYFKTKKKIF